MLYHLLRGWCQEKAYNTNREDQGERMRSAELIPERILALAVFLYLAHQSLQLYEVENDYDQYNSAVSSWCELSMLEKQRLSKYPPLG